MKNHDGHLQVSQVGGNGKKEHEEGNGIHRLHNDERDCEARQENLALGNANVCRLDLKARSEYASHLRASDEPKSNAAH